MSEQELSEQKTTNEMLEDENEEEHINVETTVEDFRQELAAIGGIEISGTAKVTEEKKTRSAYVRERVAASQERERRRKEKEIFLTGWGGLRTAMQNSKILSAQITGVVMNTKIEQVFLNMIIDDRYKAIIPFGELYRDYPIDESTIDPNVKRGRDSRLNRERRFAKKFKGQTVPFCITHMELPDDNNFQDHSIICSRRKALAVLEKVNYVPQRDGHTNIEEGGVYDADIVTIGKQGLWVNLAGVDAHMDLRNITYQYVYDLEKVYLPGTKLKVLVEKISTDEDGNHKLYLNAKQAELASAKEREYLLDIGTETDMIVSAVNYSKNKNIVLFLGWLPYYRMPALASYVPPEAVMERVDSGRTVRVSITRVAENGMIVCRCTGIEEISNFDK